MLLENANKIFNEIFNKKIVYFLVALPIHEIGHIITAGGITQPYFEYAPRYDPFTFVVLLPPGTWTWYVALAGFIFTIPVLWCYWKKWQWKSVWFFIWLVFMTRWDFIFVVRGIV